MLKSEKERVVADLVERLRSSDTLIVADYRGLTNADLVELRAKVRGSGGRLQVVKNTLTRRAAEEAGTGSLLALLEGPTAIAFVQTDGDPVAVAKPPRVAAPVVVRVENRPVAAVVAPTGVPSIAPPVIATAEAACVAMVPRARRVRPAAASARSRKLRPNEVVESEAIASRSASQA